MSKFGFGRAAQQMKQAIKESAIEIMRTSKLHFAENFDSESFNGTKWQEVSRRIPGTIFYEKQVATAHNKATGARFTVDQGADWQTRKILDGTTGRLRYKTFRADSSITNYGAVSTMTNPVPYAGWINDGTPYMPARPFMKQDQALTDKQLLILKTKTGQIWTKM